MKRPRVCPAFVPGLLAALAVLLFSPAASAEQQDGALVTQENTVAADTQTETAAALLRQGEWEAAFAILRPRTANDPQARSLLFETGLAALGAAHDPALAEADREALLDISIEAFRAILAADPELTRVRLELARAFFLKRQDRLARRQFERVLAGNVPDPVVANINRFLAEIRARRRWVAYGGLALAPDTNIGAAPAQEARLIDTPFGRLPFTPDDKPTSGVGMAVWAGWEYQAPLGEAMRLRVGGDISRREYKGSRFDKMTLGGHIGPRWLIGQRTEASLLALAQRRWQASETSYDELGFRLEGQHNPGPRTLLTFSASMRERNWKAAADLDGPVVGFTLGTRYQATSNLLLNAFFFWERDRPDRASLRNRSYGLTLGASQDLPRGFTLGLNGSLSWAQYEERGFLTTDDKRRGDRTSSLSFDLTKRDLTIGGFSPRLTIGHTWRNTNAVFQDYKRTFSEISVVRQF